MACKPTKTQLLEALRRNNTDFTPTRLSAERDPSSTSPYEVAGDAVTYAGKPLAPPARAEDFHLLAPAWGTDLQHVYYGARSLAEAEVLSFALLGGFYAKDARHVFYKDTILEEADSKSLVVLSDHSARDAGHVFLGARSTGWDPATYMELQGSHGVTKDRTGVYATWLDGDGEGTPKFEMLEAADAATFEYDGRRDGAHYFRDSKHLYRLENFPTTLQVVEEPAAD